MDQERVQELLQQGISYMIGEAYEEAKKKFELCIKENPQEAEAYIHLGNALTNLENYEEAIKAFKTALMLRPGDGEILFAIGNVWFLEDNYAEAIKAYNKAEEAGYRKEDLYTIMAGIFMESDDFVQAIRMISKAIQVEPLHGELYTQKVALQLQQKDYDGAETTLQEYQALLPDAYDVYELSAQLYCGRGKYEKAKEILDTAVERFPADPAIKLLVVKFYIETEDFDQALACAKEMTDMPMTEELKRQLVLFHTTAEANLGNADEVERILEEYLEQTWDEEFCYLLMNTYQSVQKYEKVKMTAEKLIAQGSSDGMKATGKFYHISAREALDGFETVQAEYKALCNEFRKMTLKDPGLYEVYIYRLMCHVKIKEYDKALELGDYLENVQPDLADGHMYKSYVYRMMGDKEKAKEEEQKAKAINPKLIFKE